MVSLILQWRPELASNLDINKSSPLHFASSDGDCFIIKAILTHSPPSTAYLQDSDGLSALHAAARMGHVAAVRLLLQFHPACADIRDNQGKSFLHVAAMNGHSSIVSYSVKNKMLEHLLNTQDKEGNTPLHLAVVAGEHKAISKLLSSGKVHGHIMNNAGHTPFDLVQCSTGFSAMVRLVLKLYVSGAQFKPQRQDHIEKWNGQDIMKWREKIFHRGNACEACAGDGGRARWRRRVASLPRRHEQVGGLPGRSLPPRAMLRLLGRIHRMLCTPLFSNKDQASVLRGSRRSWFYVLQRDVTPSTTDGD